MIKKNRSKTKSRNESAERNAKKPQPRSNFAKKIFSKIPKKPPSATAVNVVKHAKPSSKTPSTNKSPVQSEKKLEKVDISFRKRVKTKVSKSRRRRTRTSTSKEKTTTTQDDTQCPSIEKMEASAEKSHAPASAINGEVVEKTVLKMMEQWKDNTKHFIIDCWDHIEDIEVADEAIQEFLKNDDKNQAEEIECLDANRVKLERLSTSLSTYIHANYVDIQKVDRKFILTQLPKLTAELREDFWTMVYQQPIHNMYILCQPEESQKPGAERFSEYFPLTLGKYEYYGCIWVNNRKVELANEAEGRVNDVYTIEVLPEGCAESVMVTIHLCTYWPESLPPTSVKNVISTATNLMGGKGSYESDPICLVSKLGAGRPGTFLLIAAAIDMLKNGVVPEMKELVTSIRTQRPGGIDTEAQLATAFLCICKFAVEHCPGEETKKKIKSDIKKIQKYMKTIDVEVLTDKDST